MEKNFKDWHNKKSKIDQIFDRPFFHEREIWYCHLGLNIGFEQDGGGLDYLRPVIIFKKFNHEIFLGLPLTRTKKQSKFYFQFEFEGRESSAILSQIKLIDAKRLNNKLGLISEKDFQNLKEKLTAVLL